MRARIGDLAIARFSPIKTDKSQGKKWDECVCLVIGCTADDLNCRPRKYKFIYWQNIKSRKVVVHTGFLPSSRLIRARPKRDDWEGTLFSLTLDNVEPD